MSDDTTPRLTTPPLVDLYLAPTDKSEALRALAQRLVAEGRVTDLDGFLADVHAREAQAPTGLGDGIGIPHCRSAHVTAPSVVFGRSTHGVDFAAPDGRPADLIFMIAAPNGADDTHLAILASLARRLMDPQFTDALRSATDPTRAAALVSGESAGAGEAAAANAPAAGTASAAASASRGAAPGAGAGETGATDAPAAGKASAAASAGSGAARGGAPGTGAGEAAAANARAAGNPGGAATIGAGAGEAGANQAPDAARAGLRIVAVTSCPTGIAHTYMAAKSLELAAERAGAQIQVETQGSAGFEPLAPEVIAAADAVIFAHDVEVRDRDRFAGKPTVDVGVKAGVNRADELVAEAARLAEGHQPSPTAAVAAPTPRPDEHWAKRLRTYLMSGVSYMIPFVAAGGLLIALGFAIGGYQIKSAPSVVGHFDWSSKESWAALLFQTGAAAFGFLVPILAGFIAYAIGDRAALAAGIVGGAISVTVGAGFLGGIVAGLLAGFLVRWMLRWKVPNAVAGIMPVVVIPLLSVTAIGLLMFVVLGSPIASLMHALTTWLNGLNGTNAILLGLLLGGMMAVDMGGPINKVAYTFAAGALTTAGTVPDAGSLKVMAAVMAGGMTPPLGLALATTLRGRFFTREERENGKAAWVLGASFITEGAIPFAAADPLRVIPAGILGSMTAGGLSMAFGCTLRAPHGGIWVLPLIGAPLLYLLAVAAGTAVTALTVITLKSRRRVPSPTAPTEPDAPASQQPAVLAA